MPIKSSTRRRKVAAIRSYLASGSIPGALAGRGFRPGTIPTIPRSAVASRFGKRARAHASPTRSESTNLPYRRSRVIARYRSIDSTIRRGYLAYGRKLRRWLRLVSKPPCPKAGGQRSLAGREKGGSSRDAASRKRSTRSMRIDGRRKRGLSAITISAGHLSFRDSRANAAAVTALERREREREIRKV